MVFLEFCCFFENCWLLWNFLSEVGYPKSVSDSLLGASAMCGRSQPTSQFLEELRKSSCAVVEN